MEQNNPLTSILKAMPLKLIEKHNRNLDTNRWNLQDWRVVVKLSQGTTVNRNDSLGNMDVFTKLILLTLTNSRNLIQNVKCSCHGFTRWQDNRQSHRYILYTLGNRNVFWKRHGNPYHQYHLNQSGLTSFAIFCMLIDTFLSVSRFQEVYFRKV